MAQSEKPLEAAQRTVGLDGEGNLWDILDTLAQDPKTVNLSIGFPDFSPPPEVTMDLRNVTDGLDDAGTGKSSDAIAYHQYTRGFGHPRLSRALSTLYTSLLGRDHTPIDPFQEVITTNGATEALYIAISGLVNPGDEVVVIEPFFDTYVPQVKLAGGTPVFVPLRFRTDGEAPSSADFYLDEEELTAAFSSRTKAMVLNTPHNPTGKMFSVDELKIIAALCRRYNAVLISDEVYEWHVYGDQQHVRMATLPGMWERTITIGSAGKTFSVTGWHFGWAIGPSNLLAGPRMVHQQFGYIVNTPVQEALARSFERETALLHSGSQRCYFTSLAKQCEKSRDRMVVVLRDAGLRPIVPQGGYFISADISDVMKNVNVGGDPNQPMDFRFVMWLAKEKKLLTFPQSYFFSEKNKSIGEKFIRVCFIKNNATLSDAESILKQLL